MWASLLLSILGKAITSSAQQKALKKQGAAVKRGQERQDVQSEKARKAVMSQASELDPTKRQEAMTTSAGETESRINNLLTEAAAVDAGAAPPQGRVSENVLKDQAQTVRDRANAASILAALTGKLRAPGYVGREEESRRMGTASDISGYGAQAQRQAATDRLLAEAAGRPDPRMMMLGGLADTAGMSMATGNIMSGLGTNAVAEGAMSAGTQADPYAKFFEGIKRTRSR